MNGLFIDGGICLLVGIMGQGNQFTSTEESLVHRASYVLFRGRELCKRLYRW